ncbi:hypothetical protein, partial [Nocardioides aquaticus]|uniref:hypothetical protein n=1 Tax=Nocardioides aquaticus TaxID=160826 RepID=UPI0031D43F88
MRLPPHRPSVRRARTLLPRLLPALLLVSLVATTTPSTAADRGLRTTGSTEPAPRAQRALDDARSALAGLGGDPGSALRDLHRALPRLG